MKIAIAHGNIVSRDAIGTDILGMQRTLQICGFDVSLIAEHFDETTEALPNAIKLKDGVLIPQPDILVYHHSIFWPRGEAMVRAMPSTSRLMKYHNVTPPEFFEDYSPDYVRLCAAGREQTNRLISLFGENDQLSAASQYSARELISAGAKGAVSVAAPFMNVARFLRPASPIPKPPFTALFVGRMAPHKGHFRLLTIVAAYTAAFGPGLRLIMVGGLDDLLDDYGRQIRAQITALGIENQVEIVETVNDTQLRALFAEASVFLSMSEHEGFCVPVIEAQAAGVPIISTNGTALRETIGEGQLVVDPPKTKVDYAAIARLIHAVCTQGALRTQVITAGYRNFFNRFRPSSLADQFMDTLVPILERLA